MISKELGIELNNHFDMQMFFDILTNEISFKITAGDKLIERRYFDGKIQENFDTDHFNLYTAAAYHNLGR